MAVSTTYPRLSTKYGEKDYSLRCPKPMCQDGCTSGSVAFSTISQLE